MPMHIEKTYHEDVSPHDPDGGLDSAYRYFLFRFTSHDGQTLVARSYVDAPLEAHFLRFETEGRTHILAADIGSDLFKKAAAYLRAQGKVDITWLSVDGQAYVPIPRQG